MTEKGTQFFSEAQENISSEPGNVFQVKVKDERAIALKIAS